MITIEDFWAQAKAEEQAADDEVRRDQWGRPLIVPPPNYSGEPSKRKDGLLSYSRASSFGKELEDTRFLDDWIQRQVARGVALRPDLVARANEIGNPDDAPAAAQKGYKAALNLIVEEAKEAAGSNVKSKLGTAIHHATELVDRGDSLEGLDPLLVDRANAYWRFCREMQMTITSIETFGVEDVHQVAGTWDRTGWWRRWHKILDVKTSGTMDFAGITFAVQLAEYAHMCAYDLRTGERTPHEVMDLEEGVIIHVDRNLGGPVELYTVDLTVGWAWAKLVHAVRTARKEGKASIREFHTTPAIEAVAACRTYDEGYAMAAALPNLAALTELEVQAIGDILGGLPR